MHWDVSGLSTLVISMAAGVTGRNSGMTLGLSFLWAITVIFLKQTSVNQGCTSRDIFADTISDYFCYGWELIWWSVLYTTVQKFGDFFFYERNTALYSKHEYIFFLSDSKDIYNDRTFQINTVLLSFLYIKISWKTMVCAKIWSSTTVFNIDISDLSQNIEN